MEERKHTRIPLSEIKESSDKGVYLTKEELRKYGIFAGIVLCLVGIAALFDRKH